MSLIPTTLRDPFWDDPHFSSSRRDFEDMRRDMLREAKDFWSKVDDDDLRPERQRLSNPTMPRWLMPSSSGFDRQLDSQTLRMHEDDSKMEITLDVHNYKPEELKESQFHSLKRLFG